MLDAGKSAQVRPDLREQLEHGVGTQPVDTREVHAGPIGSFLREHRAPTGAWDAPGGSPGEAAGVASAGGWLGVARLVGHSVVRGPGHRRDVDNNAADVLVVIRTIHRIRSGELRADRVVPPAGVEFAMAEHVAATIGSKE